MSMMCRPKWPFLHVYGSHDMRHVDFRGLTGCQRTPGFWGVTSEVYGALLEEFPKGYGHTADHEYNFPPTDRWLVGEDYTCVRGHAVSMRPGSSG